MHTLYRVEKTNICCHKKKKKTWYGQKEKLTHWCLIFLLFCRALGSFFSSLAHFHSWGDFLLFPSMSSWYIPGILPVLYFSLKRYWNCLWEKRIPIGRREVGRWIFRGNWSHALSEMPHASSEMSISGWALSCHAQALASSLAPQSKPRNNSWAFRR